MMLINSLLAHATDARWEEFIGELQRLNVRKAVIVRLFLLNKEALQSSHFTCLIAPHVFTYHRRSHILHP